MIENPLAVGTIEVRLAAITSCGGTTQAVPYLQQRLARQPNGVKHSDL